MLVLSYHLYWCVLIISYVKWKRWYLVFLIFLSCLAGLWCQEGLHFLEGQVILLLQIVLGTLGCLILEYLGLLWVLVHLWLLRENKYHNEHFYVYREKIYKFISMKSWNLTWSLWASMVANDMRQRGKGSEATTFWNEECPVPHSGISYGFFKSHLPTFGLILIFCGFHVAVAYIWYQDGLFLLLCTAMLVLWNWLQLHCPRFSGAGIHCLCSMILIRFYLFYFFQFISCPFCKQA